MMLWIQRHKRVLIALGLSLFMWFIGVVSMNYELELTGFLFIVMAIGFTAYLLLAWLLKKSKRRRLHSRIEVWSIAIVMGLLFLIGAFEAEPSSPQLTELFVLLLIYVLMFMGVLARNAYLRKQGREAIAQSSINQLAFWSFAVGVGRILIVFDNYNDDELEVLTSFVYFPLMFFLVIRWIFSQTKSIIELKNEKSKTELLHLKSQVNPHFFFNMLNNLYGLVGKDSKKAQKLILKLSDMMRYSIYEGQKDMVQLDEEIEYLQSFIELNKMRYHKKIDIEFTIDVDDNNMKVMPLLFIILLENAFKHGVENLIENAYVQVRLRAEANQLHFMVENNFDPEEQPEQPGIGLKNLTRRLELVYPKKHDLSYSISDKIYTANLSLTL